MGQLLKIIAILAVLFVNDSLSQIVYSCATPNNLDGVCIDLFQCPPLLEIFNKDIVSPMEKSFLKHSQCGRMANTVLVCCPYDSQSRSNNPTTTQTIDNSHLLPNTRQCGHSIRIDNRIVGGNVTKMDEYPWVALIEYTKPGNNKGHHCGGSLVNNRYVITAAHCVTGPVLRSDWSVSGVRLGEWDRTTDPDCEVSRNGKTNCADPHLDVGIEQIIYHPKYNSRNNNYLNDIALIRLDRSINYSDFISPVCLPIQSHMRSKTFENIKMDVIGWGATEHGFSSGVKLKATVDGWSLNDCFQRYATKRINLEHTHMCAGGEGDVDSCNGDSGGPLVVRERLDNRDVYVLAGIVSFGPKPCGKSGWPGVYTRVGAYVDWITNTIRA